MIKNKDEYLTTREASKIVGLSPDYLTKLIRRGTLKGEKLGQTWVIKKKSLKTLERVRFPRIGDKENGKNK